MKTVLTAAALLLLTTPTAAQDPDPPAWTREPLAFDVAQFHVEGDLLLPREGDAFPVVVYVWGAGPTNREGTIDKSSVLREMIDAGYAVYLHDKPGSGGSTGDFTSGRLFRERATITAAALDRLAEHPRVDPTRLGLYGSSQAAYVIPLVLHASERVAFLICWSCPLENSVEQGAYLVENLVRCAGRSDAMALEAGQRYRNRALAPDYAAYLGAAKWLDALPEVSQELGWGGVWDDTVWRPMTEDSESLFDPGEEFPSLDLPTLVIYGSLDRNVDPVQGETRFRELFLEGPAGGQEIVVVEGVDHNMRRTPDGCIQHQLQGYRDLEDAPLARAFVTAVGDWLRALSTLDD